MRERTLAAVLSLAVALALPAWAAEQPPGECADELKTAAGSCAGKQEIKQAGAAFDRGVKLAASRHTAAAFAAFDQAAGLLPHNLEYVTAREVARQQLVFEHLERGNDLLAKQQSLPALAEFRAAVELDPGNAFAQQRLKDALGERAPRLTHGLQLASESAEIELAPQVGLRDFHYRGDTRGLVAQVAAAYGVSAVIDESVLARPVRFDLERVDFETAMRVAGMMGKFFWTPLNPRQILVAAETPENHRQYDRVSERTFYLPFATTPQEINELVGVLRGLFEIRSISPSASKGVLVLRAPKPQLDPATRFLESLGEGRAQVLLDMKVYEISQTSLRNLGVQLPLQYQMFNLPSLASLFAANPSLLDQINQLIASGGINQANTQAIAALLAQAQAQSANPLLTTPFFIFGGGSTTMAVTVPPAVLNFSFNSSNFRSLEHMTLRASDGDPATFFVGQRFPVLNATFSPIFNTPAVAQVIANNSFIAPFPSFTYEDLGLSVKATPQVHPSGDLTLLLDMTIQQLAGVSANGIPALVHREYAGTVRLKNGETAVVVGAISRSDQPERTGLPGLGNLPVLGRLVTNENVQHTEDELLVVITPRLVSPSESSAQTEIWLPYPR
ncbi:MAG TPA: type II and III secretion system protein [Terriglobales bacterium]|nr:type II and III secretion system protein [Terriglobales bacterium]